ncbi:MAG: hypothetical protein KDH96_02850 [Candidatus Riesia sp.]|nr:hypothetical protein [Candidatus Riesia sp.]
MLFENLMNLCDNKESGFYFVDQIYAEDDHLYRIFSYRLGGSYTNWLLPDALNCRGTMFRKEGDNWKLVCLPMPKCFRLRENPIIMEQESKLEKIDFFLKLDGSLISTFIDANDNIGVKSKTSLTSPHSKVAKQLIHNVLSYYNITKDMCKKYTYNFELCSSDPSMRVVIKYDETKLVLLNSRSLSGGIVYHNRELLMFQQTSIDTIEKYLETQTDIEGVIGFHFNSNVTFKMKTKWYDELHYSKTKFNEDSVISLFLMDKLDDYRSMHYDDVGMMQKINYVLTIIEPVYNTIISNVESFYQDNKELSRKDFAVLIQQTFSESVYLTLLMMMYNNRLTDILKQEVLYKHLTNVYKQIGEQINGF